MSTYVDMITCTRTHVPTHVSAYSFMHTYAHVLTHVRTKSICTYVRTHAYSIACGLTRTLGAGTEDCWNADEGKGVMGLVLWITM